MASGLKPGKRLKPKRKCCKSKPRCKRCPIVLQRLAKDGLVVRGADGRYVVIEPVRKRALKAARR